MTKETKSLLEFLDRSPTPWHAVSQASTRLQKAGFQLLDERDTWNLKAAGRYFVVRGGTSLIAFSVPKKKLHSVRLAAAHTDSPGFKLKPHAEFRKENMILLGVEVYGAPLITSWLNRDLGIAGRILTRDVKGKVHEALVCLDQHPVVLPQLAIHLDRQVNEQGLVLNQQEQLAALAALVDPKEKGSYLERLLKTQVSFKELISTDLFLFPLEKAALVGDKQQLIAAYRIDNLNSAHAALRGLCEQHSVADDALQMVVLWDHEEIGSGSAQGAASPFLAHVLERIALAQGLTRADYLSLLRRSLCVSADLGHALHPNYSDKHEPHHPLLMEKGIVIKYSAQQRYASDARSAGAIVALCQEHKIPVQHFITRGDIKAGSTIGPIHASVTGMSTVDIGCAQLSMHSCRELTSVQDYLYMAKLLHAFLKEPFPL